VAGLNLSVSYFTILDRIEGWIKPILNIVLYVIIEFACFCPHCRLLNTIDQEMLVPCCVIVDWYMASLGLPSRYQELQIRLES
jgi:hypothetical protein